jgi:hypothetical protein
VIRTPLDSLDARTMTLRDPDGRTHPLSVRQRLMLLILDGHCRNRCYCWVGNAELAAAYGCEERTNGIGETPFPVYPIPEAAGETAAPLGRSPPSFRGGFTVIPGRVHRHSGEGSPSFRGGFTVIPGRVHRHSGEDFFRKSLHGKGNFSLTVLTLLT